MTDSFIKLQIRSRVFSWIIFLLPATALTTRRGLGVVEVAVLLCTLFFLLPLWQQRNAVFKSARWIVAAFAINLTIAAASTAWSGFQFSSIDNAIRQLLAVAAIGLIGLARPAPERFWQGVYLGAAGTAGIALYQRFGLQMERSEGFHQTIMFGDIAMAMGLMSLASIQRFARTRWALFPYIAFLAGLTASILSGSRGGWLAMILSFIPLYSYGRRAVGKKILAVAAIGAVLLVSACFIPQLKVGSRLAEVSADIHQFQQGNPNSSVGARLEMWKGAWKMFSEHPLIGVGRTNFNPALNALIARGELHPSVGKYYHAHNELLHALATEGLIGAGALILLYAAPFVFFMRAVRRGGASQPYALAGLLLVLAFIDFGLTQVLFAHHIGTGFYALTVSVLAGLCIALAPTADYAADSPRPYPG